MGRVDHNKEIAAAARSVLAPLGCVRKGRSRTWLDDHGWWVGVIEFQPSGWSKGSYLNVGASYLWMPAGIEPHLSFDSVVGPRPWYPAVEGESFNGRAMWLASIARDGLTRLRGHHEGIATAADWLEGHWSRRDLWQHYHLGMAFGLSGRPDSAKRHFLRGAESPAGHDWVKTLSRECETYAALVQDGRGFRAAVIERIRATRDALKIRPVGPEALEPDIPQCRRW